MILFEYGVSTVVKLAVFDKARPGSSIKRPCVMCIVRDDVLLETRQRYASLAHIVILEVFAASRSSSQHHIADDGVCKGQSVLFLPDAERNEK